MHRELLFPTPVYIADIKHPTLNQDLERDIIAWSKEDKGIKRTNVSFFLIFQYILLNCFSK